ncbi:BspA family leucine-rich repeat surface protein [Williamsoniiplasma lucivorax]|uniref:Lipoprotein n=1 Tax=Williamsoniiplasma lucivorax TaxID=209274 RepID=A0A2S5R9Z0_9MOLU|nr:BspA family leucine-rich repeat surface protein [Williamsoniiplasma lucivorax]PPE04117.1 hypothetical protein ELUCI_v1c08970 [Williamsoniiplasma lucivorax]
MKKIIMSLGTISTLGASVSSIVACQKSVKSQVEPIVNYNTFKLLVSKAKGVKLGTRTRPAFVQLQEAIAEAESLSKNSIFLEQAKIDKAWINLENAIQAFYNPNQHLTNNAELLKLIELGKATLRMDRVGHTKTAIDNLGLEIARAQIINLLEREQQAKIDYAVAFLNHAINTYKGVLTPKIDLQIVQYELEKNFYEIEEHWNVNALCDALNQEGIDVMDGITVSEVTIDPLLNEERLDIKKFVMSASSTSRFTGNIALYQVLNKACQNKTIYIEKLTGKIRSTEQSAPDETTEILNIGWDSHFIAHAMPIEIQKIPNYISPLITSLENLFDSKEKVDQRIVFNQNLANWNTRNITNMQGVFRGATRFNGDISTWNTANVITMENMFFSAWAFNQDLSKWDTSKVQDMSGMFCDTRAFNQDLSKWNTANVESMSQMFTSTKAFNQDLSDWNIAKVKNMSGMFQRAELFNTDLSKWNTANVKHMAMMFYQAQTFNQDISRWNVEGIVSFNFFAFASKLIPSHQPPKFRQL